MRLERVLAIESACRLRLDTGRLIIERHGQPSAQVALVDIGALVFDTPQIEVTAGLLQACRALLEMVISPKCKASKKFRSAVYA